MRKTALLTGVAGLFLLTAPAFAQDAPAPQTAPAPAAAAPAAPQSLTLQPGSDVKGSDGAVLGKLEGARNGAGGQELTIRGADGQLRAVPVSGGVRQDGAGVAVGWTSAQFQSSPVIADAEAGAAAEASTDADADADASAAMPATPATPATPAEPAAEAAPATPATPATPTVPVEPATPGVKPMPGMTHDASPPAGEAADPAKPDA